MVSLLLGWCPPGPDNLVTLLYCVFMFSKYCAMCLELKTLNRVYFYIDQQQFSGRTKHILSNPNRFIQIGLAVCGRALELFMLTSAD